MKKWKISRLKIENFKPFEDALFDFRAMSLITLDGPNGFGKTSIFDALELLFTGSISRIVKTNAATIARNARQTNFSENIYWNRSKLGPISIKIELTDVDTNETITLERTAEESDLSNPENNAPDNFDIFKLYKIPSLSIATPKEETSLTSLEKTLGLNFLKNFPILNYLEQGQNRYLYSKKANERRDGINHLINIDQLSTEIARCSDIEKEITAKYTGAEHQKTINTLKAKLEGLNQKFHSSSQDVSHKRLSTALPTPNWDLETPPFSDTENDIEHLLKELELIKTISLNYKEVTLRRKNKLIDTFLLKESDIKISLQLGAKTDNHSSLKLTNSLLQSLKKDIETLKKPIDEITHDQLDAIRSNLDLEKIKDLTNKRNEILKSSSEQQKTLVELLHAHAAFSETHKKCDNSTDSKCPYCGHLWPSVVILQKAIQSTNEQLRKDIEKSAIELDSISQSLQDSLNESTNSLQRQYKTAELSFDPKLYAALNAAETKFPIIRETLKTLELYNIQPNTSYVHEASEIDILFEKTKTAINSTKEMENNVLPENWSTLLKLNFADETDITKISNDDFTTKETYLKIEHQKNKTAAYKNTQIELSNATRKIESAKIVKNKVIKLRKELENTAKRYAKKTISDIELLFHIYSGRLIQNYQRGLGLFISSGNGDILKFNTADKSDHDAILSMSSGQIASLGMAFFLTLNRVYANNAFILIDDPVQSMDEINIASLSDLLRVELSDRQILLSNHEAEVSTYIRYKFKRAGLSQASISMLKHPLADN